MNFFQVYSDIYHPHCFYRLFKLKLFRDLPIRLWCRGDAVYQIKIKKDAQKVLDKLPPKVQRNIREKIRGLAVDPRKLSGAEKLAGFESRYRFPAGSFRVIFEIEDDELIVTVIKIGPRGDVYKAVGG